jgi:hypothetical protein
MNGNSPRYNMFHLITLSEKDMGIATERLSASIYSLWDHEEAPK